MKCTDENNLFDGLLNEVYNIKETKDKMILDISKIYDDCIDYIVSKIFHSQTVIL